MHYYHFLRRILFALPPEFSHAFTLNCLQKLAALQIINAPLGSRAKIHLLGLDFKNRVGTAAGIDKNGDYINGLAALGFGFLELGTVTPKPQRGNSKPRLFRLTGADALINRLGFNNKGIDYLLHQVQKQKPVNCIMGINIGKNATTPIDQSIHDYQYGLTRVYPWTDYVTINISSPNTTGLRDLQEGKAFIDLLTALKQTQHQLAEQTHLYKPLLIKIAPDLSDEQIKVLAEQLLHLNIDGVIATNTTINKTKVSKELHAQETGGLSGRPLMEQSTHVVSVLRNALGKNFPIIAAGGIMSVADANEKRAAGADLVQLYTGLVYEGPGWVRRLIEEIV